MQTEDPPLCIEADPAAGHMRRPETVVAEILLTGPGELDRRTGPTACDLDRLPNEIGLPFPTESPAEKSHL